MQFKRANAHHQLGDPLTKDGADFYLRHVMATGEHMWLKDQGTHQKTEAQRKLVKAKAPKKHDIAKLNKVVSGIK